MRTFLAVFVLTVSSLHAQAIRYDWISSSTNSSCASGVLCPLLAIPGTTVSVCQGTPATLTACLASLATTYTNAGAGTPCATTSQLTPATGGACRSTSDNQGNYGFWILPGSYSYYLRVPATAGGGTYGPYPVNIGASAGCPLGVTCDASYATLALGCTAAGVNGTLYITRNWNATSTGTYCHMQFLGNGKLTLAVNATATMPVPVASPTQQIFDTSASGSAVLFTSPATLTPANWGGDISGSVLSSASFLACIASASASGGVCSVNSIYKIHNVSFTVGAKNFSIEGCSPNCGFIDVTADGTDSLTLTWPNQVPRPRVSIKHINYVGPDSTHAGAGSGNGIKITGVSNTPWVDVEDVQGAFYYGSGKAALWDDGSEDSSYKFVQMGASDIGFKFSNSFNANTLTSIRAFVNYSKGIDCEACLNNTFNSMLAESNGLEGIRIQGAANTLNSPHAENNNTLATAGLCTVIFYGINTTGPAGATIGNVINSPDFLGSHEKLCFHSDGTNPVGYNVIVGGVSSGLTGGIDFDAYGPIETFIGFTALSQITGATTNTVIIADQVGSSSYFSSGTSTAPGIGFTADPTTGLRRAASGVIGTVFSGVVGNVGFSATGVNAGPSINNLIGGSIPTFATVTAAVGACGSLGAPEGAMIYVHDGNGATVGSTLSAGGSTHAEHAVCNGAAWIVSSIP